MCNNKEGSEEWGLADVLIIHCFILHLQKRGVGHSHFHWNRALPWRAKYIPVSFVPVRIHPCFHWRWKQVERNSFLNGIKCQDDSFRRCWNYRRGPVWQQKTEKIVAAVTAGPSAILSLPIEHSIKHVLERIFYAKTHPRCHPTAHLAKVKLRRRRGFHLLHAQFITAGQRKWNPEKKLSHSRGKDIKESSSCKEDVHDVRNVCAVS